MVIARYLAIMLIIMTGSCVQGALGFGTTMVTMGLLPLLMPYSKALGLSIIMVTISTVYVAFRYRTFIQWKVMLPFLIPTVIISGIVNILSAQISSSVMYLLLGVMFVLVSGFFFFFSDKVRVRPTPVSGTILGILCGIFHGLFASGGPTAALYLLPATRNKKEYLATIQAFLCVNNILILILSLALRRLETGDLPMAAAGIAAMIAGTLLGLRIHDRIPAELFGKIIYAFVGLGGLWIIISHLV